MARDSDIKTYINYIENKVYREFEAYKRDKNQVEILKKYYKAYNENLKNAEEVEKKEKRKTPRGINTNIKEIIKIQNLANQNIARYHL